MSLRRILSGGASWFRKVNDHIDMATEAISDIRDDIREIQRDVERILLRPAGGAAFEGGSPLRLTELGQKVADELDTASWLEKVIPDLRDRTKGEPPDVIEEVCFDFLVYSDDFRPVQELAVKIRATAYEHGLAREQVRGVMALVLRDELIRLEHGSGAVDQSAEVATRPTQSGLSQSRTGLAPHWNLPIHGLRAPHFGQALAERETLI